eukprot:Gb_25225 [translate_table: standard]
MKGMEELVEDIKKHLEVDRETTMHIEFWETLMVVCDWEIIERKKIDSTDKVMHRERPPTRSLSEEKGLHANIIVDVEILLKDKNYKELVQIYSQIMSKMNSRIVKSMEY